MDRDAEHLRLLAIFHWIVAGLTALCSLFPLLHLAVGIAMVTGRFPDHGHDEFSRAFGWFFIVFAAGIICLGLCFAACLAFAGRCIAQRRNRTYCLVISALSCAWFPFGTVLGVFTIVVLSKDSVHALFEGAPRATVS